MEPLFLVLGLVTAVGISALHGRHPEPPHPTIPFFRFMFFLPWLFYRILLSNFHTVFLILHPRLPINPKMILYQTHLRNPAAITLLANSITLTPGTVTAEVNSSNLVVHALDEDSANDLVTDRLEKKIFWVFGKKGTQ
jgi:multicomponent Na+:H+ antiporter subunit E